jgi:hypothetical protein
VFYFVCHGFTIIIIEPFFENILVGIGKYRLILEKAFRDGCSGLGRSVFPTLFSSHSIALSMW